MKKPETAKKNEGFQDVAPLVIDMVTVDHVRMTGDVVYFTLIINWITVNNCKVVEGKNGDFISLPQYQGKNNKWYNVVWFKLSDDDQKRILEMVEYQLNQ